MRLTPRSLLGLASVAAIVISASVGGTALASHGADDTTPHRTGVHLGNDRGGLTNRDQRNEPGDDRRANGTPAASATSVPTSSSSTSSKPAAAKKTTVKKTD